MKNGMTYAALLEQAAKANTPREARALHRELKKHGSGLSLFDRYPAQVCALLAAMAGAALAVTILAAAG